MANPSDDPSDRDIELLLESAPATGWDSLWAAVSELKQETDHVEWGGGQQVDTTVIDGVEKPVFQMPYAVYSDATNRVLESLYELGAIVPFNWPEWDGATTYRDRDAIASAPVADAVRMITAIVRADRFSEGTIAAMLEDGTLLAALDRLQRWYEGERPSL